MNARHLILRWSVVISAALLLAGCASQPAPSAIQPTATPVARETVQPAENPTPTATPTSHPTPTPTTSPTATPLPTVVSSVRMVGTIFYLTTDRRTIRRIRPDGSDDQPILTIAEDEGSIAGYSVSPTGDYLAYRQREVEQLALYLFRDGHSQRLDLPSGTVAWSPDGTRFILNVSWFLEDPRAEMVSLYNVPTGQVTRLPVKGHASWFPNGESLLLVSSRNTPEDSERWLNPPPSTSELVRYDLASGTSITLTDLLNTPMPAWKTDTITDAWTITSAQVHPDGTHVLFTGGQRGNLGAQHNNSSLWVFDLNEGILHYVSTHHRAAYRFSPTGTHMAYVASTHISACDNPGSIGVITTDLLQPEERRPSLSTEWQPDDPMRPSVQIATHGLDWSPAGDQIVFASKAYTCATAAKQHVVSEPALSIWDVQTGRDHTMETVPRHLRSGGIRPVWVDRGELAHPGLTPLPVPPSPTPFTLPIATPPPNPSPRAGEGFPKGVEGRG